MRRRAGSIKIPIELLGPCVFRHTSPFRDFSPVKHRPIDKAVPAIPEPLKRRKLLSDGRYTLGNGVRTRDFAQSEDVSTKYRTVATGLISYPYTHRIREEYGRISAESVRGNDPLVGIRDPRVFTQHASSLCRKTCERNYLEIERYTHIPGQTTRVNWIEIRHKPR